MDIEKYNQIVTRYTNDKQEINWKSIAEELRELIPAEPTKKQLKPVSHKRGNYIYTYEVLRYEYSPKLRHSIAVLGKCIDKQPVS